MGLASWVIAGAAVFVACRFAAAGRRPGWIGEALLALTVAVGFGIVATVLDFGGWKEPDWRAALFALFGSAAAVGIRRALSFRA